MSGKEENAAGIKAAVSKVLEDHGYKIDNSNVNLGEDRSTYRISVNVSGTRVKPPEAPAEEEKKPVENNA